LVAGALEAGALEAEALEAGALEAVEESVDAAGAEAGEDDEESLEDAVEAPAVPRESVR
jgi:hypothetical protein